MQKGTLSPDFEHLLASVDLIGTPSSDLSENSTRHLKPGCSIADQEFLAASYILNAICILNRGLILFGAKRISSEHICYLRYCIELLERSNIDSFNRSGIP